MKVDPPGGKTRGAYFFGKPAEKRGGLFNGKPGSARGAIFHEAKGLFGGNPPRSEAEGKPGIARGVFFYKSFRENPL